MLNLRLHRGSLSKNAEGGQAQFSSKKIGKKTIGQLKPNIVSIHINQVAATA
jgi:hypothetical protein